MSQQTSLIEKLIDNQKKMIPKLGNNNNNKHSQGKTGDALRAQALANARTARENLGDDTIQKLAEIMKKKENENYYCIEKKFIKSQKLFKRKVIL